MPCAPFALEGTLLAHSEAAEAKANAIMVNHNVKI